MNFLSRTSARDKRFKSRFIIVPYKTTRGKIAEMLAHLGDKNTHQRRQHDGESKDQTEAKKVSRAPALLP